MKTIFNIFLFLSTAFLFFSFEAIADPTSPSQQPPKILSFEAAPPIVMQGDSVTLVWKTSHASEVYISGIGKVNTSGSRTININFDLSEIFLTALNNGNFPPETKKLNLQTVVATTSETLPNDLKRGLGKPMILIGNQTSITKNIRKYKLRPVKIKTKSVRPYTRSLPTNNTIKAQTMQFQGITQLAAPQIISPRDNSTFSHYPRTLKLRWRPLSGAVSYNVEIDCLHCCAAKKWCTDVGREFKKIKALKDTFYKFNFVGSQPGRWRVQGVDVNGKMGKQSPWVNFKFTK